MDWTFYFLTITGVILIGVSKAGFGGGVGIAAVPIFIWAFDDSKEALAVMLPILCACDVFSLIHWRKTYDKKNILWLMPGVVLGIVIASFFLGEFTDATIKFWIGVIAIFFVMYQWGKSWVMKEMGDYHPKPWHGWLFGWTIGFTSTIAHAAGPPATMYLLPQNMGKQLYVGTTVWLFTFVNALKLIPYILLGMISLPRFSTSVFLMLFVPIGTLLGFWMNQRINETVFNAIIYIFMLLVGLKYIGILPYL